MNSEPTQVDGTNCDDLRRNALRAQLYGIRRQRAVNESIRTLLTVVQYLNQVQDGDGLRIDQTYCKTEMEKRARILNCHEEDIMNASLITMKRLIETLVPSPRRSRKVVNPALAESSAVMDNDRDG